MRERDWLIPSIVLTLLCAASAILAVPNRSGLTAALSIYPAWVAAAAVIAAICLFIRMVRLKIKHPSLELQRLLREEPGRAAFAGLVVMVAGLNMIAFMWVKPLLNYAVPFWADPYLARIDHLLFLGHDPWPLLAWLNFPAAGSVYHQVWFAMMILALILVAWAPASPEKSAMMLTYFLLWSLIGPLLHSLMPAVGPIFYERMGYGDRFSGLPEQPETRQIADYLWTIYANRHFGAGSGISAMPSLHVTLGVWIALAIHVFARWLTLPATVFAAMIFLMSIALGWHYAIDGIVGAAATLGCYFTLLPRFRERYWMKPQGTGRVPALEPVR